MKRQEKSSLPLHGDAPLRLSFSPRCILGNPVYFWFGNDGRRAAASPAQPGWFSAELGSFCGARCAGPGPLEQPHDQQPFVLSKQLLPVRAERPAPCGVSFIILTSSLRSFLSLLLTVFTLLNSVIFSVQMDISLGILRSRPAASVSCSWFGWLVPPPWLTAVGDARGSDQVSPCSALVHFVQEGALFVDGNLSLMKSKMTGVKCCPCLHTGLRPFPLA